MQSEGSSQHELCTPAISHYLTLALVRPLWQSSSPFSPVSFSNFYSLWLPHFPYLPLALPYCPALCSFLFFLHLAQTTADGRTSTDIRPQCLSKAASCFQEQPMEHWAWEAGQVTRLNLSDSNFSLQSLRKQKFFAKGHTTQELSCF